MTTTAPAPAAASPRTSDALPPVAQIATLALALVVAGGIYMATYVPRRPPLVVPTILVVAALALLAVDVVLVARLRTFAWTKFFRVLRWGLLAYVVSAGMIEFAFVKDETRGRPLLVLTLMLVVFATSVPLIIAFTVARFADPSAD